MAEDDRSLAGQREAVPRSSLGPSLSGPPIAPWRRSLDVVVSRAIDWLAVALVRHWLLLVNSAVGVYAFLPFLAPLLLAGGYNAPALAIYELYSYLCHQEPSRSWFIFGQQVAFCQRDVAAYPAMFLAGVYYGLRRDRIAPLGLKWYLLAIAPMAVDGLTQAVGLRESTWELRTVTGLLFGVATAWLAYPRFQRAIEESV